MMNKIEQYSDVGDNSQANDLWGGLVSGVHSNGIVLDDLGWASFQITEELGIEPHIGVEGFDNESEYFAWIKDVTKSQFKDWEPCRTELFLCWFPPSSNEHLFKESSSPEKCYSAWRCKPDQSALKCEAKIIYALRHKAWPLLSENRIKAFHCARQRSYAEEEWYKLHLGEPVTPQIMTDSDTGIYLYGRPIASNLEVNLTWPSPDLRENLSLAKQFSEQGFTDIHIMEGGVGFEISDLTDREIQLMLKLFRQYGEDVNLIDLAREAGIIKF